MEYQDYYGHIGVSKDANQDEIQRAYRKLARKLHPDVNKDPEAEARFKDIGEAYEVLKDPEKRKKYDRYGKAWKAAQQQGAPPPGWEGFHFDFGPGGPSGTGGPGFGFEGGGDGFSSFFEMLFGGGAPGPGWQQAGGPAGRGGGFHQAARGGADVEAQLTLSLEDVAHGGKREISLKDPAGGTKTYSVTIPKGIKNGQKIRLAGQGAPGAGGAGRGDLYLKVQIAPHPRFKLRGRALDTILPLTPWRAALGGKARVGTLDGDLAVKIPAGSSSGQKIRLRGKGLPTHGGETGDLFAEIKIVVPKELSDEEKELFEKLEEVSGFEPGSD